MNFLSVISETIEYAQDASDAIVEAINEHNRRVEKMDEDHLVYFPTWKGF